MYYPGYAAADLDMAAAAQVTDSQQDQKFAALSDYVTNTSYDDVKEQLRATKRSLGNEKEKVKRLRRDTSDLLKQLHESQLLNEEQYAKLQDFKGKCMSSNYNTPSVLHI